MSYQTEQRARLSIIRAVGRLPHGHAARAFLFKVAGQSFGASLDDLQTVVRLMLSR